MRAALDEAKFLRPDDSRDQAFILKAATEEQTTCKGLQPLLKTKFRQSSPDRSECQIHAEFKQIADA